MCQRIIQGISQELGETDSEKLPGRPPRFPERFQAKEGEASLKPEEKSKHQGQDFQLRAGSEAVPPTTEGVIALE
jgi:hypothetical protein